MDNGDSWKLPVSDTDRPTVIMTCVWRWRFMTWLCSDVVSVNKMIWRMDLRDVCLSDCLSVRLSGGWMSVCAAVCLSGWLSRLLPGPLAVYLCVCLSVSLSECMSVWLSLCLSIYLSGYILYIYHISVWLLLTQHLQSVRFTVFLSVCLAVWQAIGRLVCRSFWRAGRRTIYLPVYLPVYVSACLSIWLAL